MVLGFKIWYIPDVYIEAEEHVVWEDKNGHKIDVTPIISGEKKNPFCPIVKIRNCFF